MNELEKYRHGKLSEESQRSPVLLEKQDYFTHGSLRSERAFGHCCRNHMCNDQVLNETPRNRRRWNFFKRMFNRSRKSNAGRSHTTSDSGQEWNIHENPLATATGGSEIQVTLNLSPDALKNFATRSPEEVAQSMFSEKKLDKQLLESLIEECHKQMKLRGISVRPPVNLQSASSCSSEGLTCLRKQCEFHENENHDEGMAKDVLLDENHFRALYKDWPDRNKEFVRKRLEEWVDNNYTNEVRNGFKQFSI